MVSISKVLRYDALDGSTISPLQITASKESAKLVCDAVDTQDLCESTVTHLSLARHCPEQVPLPKFMAVVECAATMLRVYENPVFSTIGTLSELYFSTCDVTL